MFVAGFEWTVMNSYRKVLARTRENMLLKQQLQDFTDYAEGLSVRMPGQWTLEEQITALRLVLRATREDMMGDILRQQQLHSFSVTSNESVEYLTITNVSQANESLDTPTNANVSQANNQLDETLVFPTQVRAN